jgi:hypothetical protein
MRFPPKGGCFEQNTRGGSSERSLGQEGLMVREPTATAPSGQERSWNVRDSAMAVLTEACRMVVLFVAAAGFLFGQLFAGDFSIGATLAGVGGVTAGILMTFRFHFILLRVTVIGCAAGLLGAGIDVYDYYSTPHAPGNYYPWFLTAPFAVALIFIALRSLKRTARAA